MDQNKMNPQNKTAEYFYRISYLGFLVGMPNFWIEDLRIAKPFFKYYPYISKFFSLTFYMLVFLELGAFVTQNDLTTKQKTDRWIHSMSHPFLLMYMVVTAKNEQEIKEWITQVLNIREIYNDPTVEDQMVRKSAQKSLVLVATFTATVILYTFNACLLYKSEGTFTTVITAWPPVHEVSTGADVVRIITNIMWWTFFIRALSVYNFVISITTCTSFQYTNLMSYYHSLNKIFQEDLEQSDMEQKYEEGLKTGIKIHSDIFVCVNRVKKICGIVLSGQVVLIIIIMVFVLYQMLVSRYNGLSQKSKRTMVNAFTTACTASAILFSSGIFQWNAGDITIEASNVATAMYSSGWQNCRGGSGRIRRLMVTAMALAQKPVVLKGLGILDLSYETFLFLVKTSYSVFSVIY